MIADARQKATYQVNATMIDLYWGIGKFVSHKAIQDGWGRSTVKALSEYILLQEPGILQQKLEELAEMADEDKNSQ